MPRPPDINALDLAQLFEHFAHTGLVRRLIDLAADEDLGSAESATQHENPRHRSPETFTGDVTSDVCIPPDARAVAHAIARAPGVISGLRALPILLECFTTDVRQTPRAQDGAHARAGDVLVELEGPLDELLALERTLLNLLGRLSGIATLTSRYVAAIPPGAKARLFDTRKTTPGLRVLEKYAVRCGGGFCHRLGLHDAVLIKDNHLAGVRSQDLPDLVRRAAQRAKALTGDRLLFVEVEADTLEQVQALCSLPQDSLDIILLDNMTLDQLRAACALRDRAAPNLQLEASGGVSLDTIAAIAQTGVDRISVGALTHSAAALDVAMDVVDRR